MDTLKILVANLGATAYHFMINEFRITHEPTFKEKNFEFFIERFFGFVQASGYLLVDKEGKALTHNKMADEILNTYVNYTTDEMGNRVCYFDDNVVNHMRKDYEKCNFIYKNLILRLEEALARDYYSNKEIYSVIENSYRESLRYVEKDDKKNLA